MALLQLPPEILLQIFEYVGSSNFRSDLSRLRVCKQWSKFAHTACFQDFYVKQKTLERLFSSSYVETSLQLVKDSAEVLDLDLKGFQEGWPPKNSQRSWPTENLSLWCDNARAIRASWTSELDISLFRLAAAMKRSRRLRSLRIKATREPYPLLGDFERRDYLFLSTIRTFLSPGNLTSLDLDLCGTKLIPRRSQEHIEGNHICTNIAALLTTLRRLRLRMRQICAGALKPQQGSADLRLNEILINLSVHGNSLLSSAQTHPTGCGSYSASSPQLEADIKKQAQVLAAQIAAPKIIRVLTREPLNQLRAFDVLTGKTIQLSRDAKWDDDGEVIEDGVSNEEAENLHLSPDDEG